MQKIQTSKHAYSGLARIRSAGELVVGAGSEQPPLLDGPSRAGRARLRDRRPARRAARRLGSASTGPISAHDSYPSKLAAKAALRRDSGRHARRSVRAAGSLFAAVLCRASIRLVVRSGEGPPAAREPLAVEEGVAVRGLEGRPVQSYPSTEAILEAVATGREKAGYVISTRGPWLAHERWPGKLEFPPAPAESRGPLSHLCGGAKDGRRPEGRDRPGLGRARSIGPAGPGLRPLAHPVRARRGRRAEKRARAVSRFASTSLRCRWTCSVLSLGWARLLAGGLVAWRSPSARPRRAQARRSTADDRPPAARRSGRGGAGGRPGTVSRPVQRLSRRRRPRRQGPRPDRQSLDPRRHR